MPSLSPARLAELEAEVLAATQPASELERFFASEVAYATWELERVRANTSATQAESRLNSYYGRASRNWNRARKELTGIQSTRTTHQTRLTPGFRRLASQHPLAAIKTLPATRPSKKAQIAYADAIERHAAAESAQFQAEFQAANKGAK